MKLVPFAGTISDALEFSMAYAETLTVLAAAARALEAPNPIHDLVHALIPLWPLWVAIGVIGVGKVLVYLWKVRRLRRAGIFEIDRMDGPTFERRLA